MPGSSKLARSFKKSVLRRTAGSEGIDVMHRGLRLRCHVHDNATERNIVLSGDRDNGAKIDTLLAYLPVGGTFVDIGANCGLFTLAAAQRVGPTGRVIAIEPAPAMLTRLRFNIASNRLTNITTVAVAVGDKAGSADLHFNPSEWGGAKLQHSAIHMVRVPVETLEHILTTDRVDTIDAMKIDIEGFEDRALLPFFASAPVDIWPRALLMEIKYKSRWASDCVADLIAFGYRRMWNARKDSVFVR